MNIFFWKRKKTVIRIFYTVTNMCHKSIGFWKQTQKNWNLVCTTTFFKNKNISSFSVYQSQRDAVFHNQVLRCASGAACPQGPCGGRGEHQVLRPLSHHYHRDTALCPPPPPQHPRQQDGTTTAACSAALSIYIKCPSFFCFVLWNGDKTRRTHFVKAAWKHRTKMERGHFNFFGGVGEVGGRGRR